MTSRIGIIEEENLTGMLMSKIYRKWRGVVKESLLSVGVTYPQFLVLYTLKKLEHKELHVTQAMISKKSGIDIMTTSQIIRILNDKNFIYKETHPTQVRANKITLTEEGQHKLTLALELLEENDAEFFGKDEDLHNQLTLLLSQLR